MNQKLSTLMLCMKWSVVLYAQAIISILMTCPMRMTRILATRLGRFALPSPRMANRPALSCHNSHSQIQTSFLSL
jgi:hypothetical protein